jgi:energy-converting hydrogenase Eha subunit B
MRARRAANDRQERIRRVAADCSKAVTGYMTGNLVISAIAGTLTYIVLWIMGVPYKGMVALARWTSPESAWPFSWSFPCRNTLGQERKGIL